MEQIVWSESVDKILKVGRFLGEVGISNWALTRPQALEVLSQMRASGVPVLGGDVCEKDVHGRILPNYDNWHCERLLNEGNSAFLERSFLHAKEYVSNYPISDTGKVFFTIVPDV